MSRPMPSPKGTNIEGLHLRGSGFAYDAMPDAKRGKVREFLSSKLDAADIEALERLLDEDDDANEPDDAPPAMDAAFRQRVDDMRRQGRLTEDDYQRLRREGRPRAAVGEVKELTSRIRAV